jgi:SAM-dependent methyltransferase
VPSVDADRYARWHPQFALSQNIPELLRSALDRTPARGLVVDVGCGEGGSLLALRDDQHRALGFDLSHHRARAARDMGLLTSVADGTRLPLRDGSAALLLCEHVIEHVASDDLLAQELRRVLEPNGRLYLETPLRLRGAWYFYRGPTGRWVIDPTHVREYGSVGEATSVLTAAGLQIEHVRARPISYSVAHLAHRAGRFLRLVKSTSRLRFEAKWPRVRIPRYREIQILAKASD